MEATEHNSQRGNAACVLAARIVREHSLEEKLLGVTSPLNFYHLCYSL